MKSNLSALLNLLRLADRGERLLLAGVVVPLLMLAGFGLYALLRYGYLAYFLIALIVASALIVLFPKRKPKLAPVLAHEMPAGWTRLELPAHWTPRDRSVHEASVQKLDSLLQQAPDWDQLQNHAWTLVKEVAGEYRNKAKNAEWSVTPLELIAIIEHLSQRYRQVLKEHIPGIDHVRISHVLWANRHWETTGHFAKLYGIYRKVRMASPEGLLSEVSSQVLGPLVTGVKNEVQAKAKYLLLLEVLHAAIDLYGGHFRFEGDQLRISNAGEADRKRQAAEPEPVRICLLGQISAGKSSVINALMGQTRAEVSALPSTNEVQSYPFSVEGQTLMTLVDLPGLDGDLSNDNKLFKEIAEADVLLWVLKANQPARELDRQFMKRLRDWLGREENQQRQPPVIIGLLSQIDRLVKAPLSWEPPYDLAAEGQPMALFRDALAFNQEVLQLEHILPLALPTDKPTFNVPELNAVLAEHYQRAINVQLNRRRLDSQSVSLSKEWARMKSGVGAVFNLIQRS